MADSAEQIHPRMYSSRDPNQTENQKKKNRRFSNLDAIKLFTIETFINILPSNFIVKQPFYLNVQCAYVAPRTGNLSASTASTKVVTSTKRCLYAMLYRMHDARLALSGSEWLRPLPCRFRGS